MQLKSEFFERVSTPPYFFTAPLIRVHILKFWFRPPPPLSILPIIGSLPAKYLFGPEFKLNLCRAQIFNFFIFSGTFFYFFNDGYNIPNNTFLVFSLTIREEVPNGAYNNRTFLLTYYKCVILCE